MLILKLLLDHSVLQINKNDVFCDKSCINMTLAYRIASF